MARCGGQGALQTAGEGGGGGGTICQVVDLLSKVHPALGVQDSMTPHHAVSMCCLLRVKACCKFRVKGLSDVFVRGLGALGIYAVGW